MAAHVTTPAEARAILDRYDTFVFDCDGVIWTGKDAVPGIDAAVAHLVSLGKQVFYVSNNSTKDRGMYVDKFRSVGIENVTEGQVFNSGYATACYVKQYLRRHGLEGRKVYCVGEAGLRRELSKVCEVVHDPPSVRYDPDAIAREPLDADVAAVVVGLDFGFGLQKLARCAHYLRYSTHSPGVAWIMTNPDMSFPAGPRQNPGTGNLMSALASNVGREPTAVCGKPNPLLFNILSEEHPSMDRARTLMVGDRLDTDIQFGHAAGVDTLMVLTGVNTAADIPAAAVKPTHVVHSVPELVRLARADAAAVAKL